MNPAIIIPAFNRPTALQRLLNSLEQSVYPVDDVKVIVSLDGGYSKDVESVAEAFQSRFHHGTVEIIKRTQNIGLREHILWCGDQTERCGSVIVLEDDLLVDKHFYLYACSALAHYDAESAVAGIALYSYRFNEYARLPFEPMNNGTTGYFMKVACSSGQCWSRSQWVDFKKWYQVASSEDLERMSSLPPAVKVWPESSWKKYFCAYLIESNRFFFYPYISYSTNCSDAGGTHITKQSHLFQIPLPASERKLEPLRFPELTTSAVKYDAFMEPLSDEFFIGIGLPEAELAVDLYGTKPLPLLQRKKYTITTRKQKVYQKAYLLSFRPIEKCYLADAKQPTSSPQAFLVESSLISMAGNPYYMLAKYYSFIPFLSSREFKRGFLREALEQKIQNLFRFRGSKNSSCILFKRKFLW